MDRYFTNLLKEQEENQNVSLNFVNQDICRTDQLSVRPKNKVKISTSWLENPCKTSMGHRLDQFILSHRIAFSLQ